MRFLAALVLALSLVVFAGLTPFNISPPTAEATTGTCTLIDASGEHGPDSGIGHDTYAYLEAGTVVSYYISSTSSTNGAGIGIATQDWPMDGSPDILEVNGTELIEGTVTIPADDYYVIGAGSGGPEPATVVVLVTYSCEQNESMCYILDSTSGPPLGTGMEVWLNQGEVVLLVAERDDDGYIEGGIHSPNGFASDAFTGFQGTGYVELQLTAPWSGLYGFGVGPGPEGTVYLTLYGSCSRLYYPNTGLIQINAGAPVMSYGAAGNYPTGIVLPSDYDGNGFDTYVIMSAQTVGDATWYGIFVGGETMLWVPAAQVTIIE